MDLNEQKIECNVSFLRDDSDNSSLDVKDAVVHLFQHAYDNSTLFWYGVEDS